MAPIRLLPVLQLMVARDRVSGISVIADPERLRRLSLSVLG